MELQATGGVGQLRATVAVNALALAQEQVHALHLLLVHGRVIALQVGVQWRLIGD
ncbi:hypothetical protein D3C71_2205480 [compost metagenome]